MSNLIHSNIIVNFGNQIHLKVIASVHPEQDIFDLYLNAEEQDAFVAALIGQLIVYFQRWQGDMKDAKNAD